MKLLPLGAAALACLAACAASAAPAPRRNPNPEAATPDPTNETEETNAGGARTSIETNARIGVGIPKTTGRDPLEEDKKASVTASSRTAPAEPRPEGPKRRLSFWERVLGGDASAK